MRKLIAVILALTLLPLFAAAAEEPVKMTSFDCEDLDGNPVDISLFDGAQLVLVDVWEAWCNWCLKEMPDLCELYELNKDHGFLIVGLSGVSSADGYDAKTTAEGLKITYPLVRGTEEMIPIELEGFPTTLVYQRQEDGNLQLADVVVGYMPREEWIEYLKGYLPELVTEAAE